MSSRVGRCRSDRVQPTIYIPPSTMGTWRFVSSFSYMGIVTLAIHATANTVMQTGSVASENCSFIAELYQMPVADGGSAVETSFRGCQDSGPRSSHLK